MMQGAVQAAALRSAMKDPASDIGPELLKNIYRYGEADLFAAVDESVSSQRFVGRCPLRRNSRGGVVAGQVRYVRRNMPMAVVSNKAESYRVQDAPGEVPLSARDVTDVFVQRRGKRCLHAPLDDGAEGARA